MTERDPSGKFLPGHAGMGGRPSRVTEYAYLAKLSDKLTLPRWSKIVEKAIEQAEEGDEKARQWLADYALPKPGTKMWFATLAAAEVFDFDLFELDALDVFEDMKRAQAVVGVAEQLAAAREAGVVNSNIVDWLKVGLFGFKPPRRGAPRTNGNPDPNADA
jgi:hypothetical protein